MKITWQPSPSKIQFGADMVIADIGIDKDHTLTIFCEEESKDVVSWWFRNLKEYPNENRTNQC